MSDAPSTLRIAPGVSIRPMAEGSIVVVGDRPPVMVRALHEQLLAVCTRPTDRDELVEVVCELSDLEPATVRQAIDELIGQGLVVAP